VNSPVTESCGCSECWQCGQTIHAEADFQAIAADIDPLDQQGHDARLLGGKEFIPERIKTGQCVTGIRLGNLAVLCAVLTGHIQLFEMMNRDGIGSLTNVVSANHQLMQLSQNGVDVLAFECAKLSKCRR
jgi:hypothetical protein